MYHGTDTKNVRSILRGALRGAAAGRGWTTPIEGYLYVTKTLPVALMHALGGNYVGSAHAPPKLKGSGAVLLLDVDMREAIPDEDWFGSLLVQVVLPQGQINPGIYGEDVQREWSRLLILAGNAFRVLPKRARESVRSAARQYEWYPTTRAGKTAVNALRRTKRGQGILAASVPYAPHVAVPPSAARVEEVWVFDRRRDNPHLRADGANFFHIARRAA